MRGIGCVFVDGDSVEGAAITLVEEEVVAFADDDYVPGVNRTGSTHQDRQNVVGGVYPGNIFTSELLDNRILGSGGVVLDTIDNLQRLLRLGGNTVVGLVVGKDATIGLTKSANQSTSREQCRISVQLLGFVDFQAKLG